MNDAGQDHPLADPAASLVAWFQVAVDTVADDRPLPVQPFPRCAGDVAARIGELNLQAVQVLLPVQVLDVPSRRAGVPSLPTARWFEGGDRHSRTPVRVTLNSGQAPSLPAVAPHLREEMSRLDQRAFVCESHSDTEHDPKMMRPPFDSGFWNGPPRHRVTFSGTFAEWSLDALGWLGGFLAGLSAQHGVTTPVLLTVTRSQQPEAATTRPDTEAWPARLSTWTTRRESFARAEWTCRHNDGRRRTQ
ncbi:hypothetical protein [Micromonospora tulbaghiae]|uniref:hypothetical protein n=1 Tax=Micromonospora tulbaghiae TaxID=479978 RepID=UPI00340C8186